MRPFLAVLFVIACIACIPAIWMLEAWAVNLLFHPANPWGIWHGAAASVLLTLVVGPLFRRNS